MSSIIVVGSMAFDSIETPFGTAPKILGGSANHFALAASLFTRVQCVSVVGEDFPKEHLALLKTRDIDTEGVRLEKGKTFHWAGSYGYDLNEAKTLTTSLNVFEHFNPEIPASYRKTPFVFLGNIAPGLQNKVRAQIENPQFVAIDTMNFWIKSDRDALIDVISQCHALFINEAEIRQLTRLHNIVQAAEKVREWGPKIVVVKRGEYGALLFTQDEAFSVPGLPLAEIKDPTGAGDTFAGGFMGYLASQKAFSVSRNVLRKALVYGSVLASFTVQEFGSAHLLNLKKDDIEDRYRRFIDLTTFHAENV